MNFFIVSAGESGSDYIEENFKDIIETNEYALHESTKQKGLYYSIEAGDVLILKYTDNLVAYGLVERKYTDQLKNFSLRVEVEKWIFYDLSYPKKGVSVRGINNALIGGWNLNAVRKVRPDFGIKKIREINSNDRRFNEILEKNSQSRINKGGDYFNLHEELFNYLLTKADEDPEFTFLVRDSNNGNALEKGYWFYGEDTVAISFWTGMDHFNDRPAISFLINPNEHCKLVIQTDIYNDLRNSFIKDRWWERILPELKITDTILEKVYNHFNPRDYIACLEEFLKTDCQKLNRIIYESNTEGKFKIGIKEEIEPFADLFVLKISFKEFTSRLNNLYKYRQNSGPDLPMYSLEDEQMADGINKITIKDYALIKDVNLELGTSKWVFITGENGAGKTMLMRSIATVLGNRILSAKEMYGKNFSVEANFISDKRGIPFNRVKNANVIYKRRLVSRGLAMYGPYRLEQTTSQSDDDLFKKSLSKVGSFKSLFKDGSKLLSLDKQLEIWFKDSNKNKALIESRIHQIKSLLPKIIPALREVQYKEKKYGKIEFEYFIKSEGTKNLIKLRWNELSSGNKNILNLVCDIIIRLYNQQSHVIDPSELRGIILIDEIDLHLHPKAQRDLVITLSETFPLLQFIVTTHSPIPLLGAPENSSIFVVKRDWENGVFTQKLVKLEKEFKYLLPNSLLTSDIFDFDFLEDIPEDQFEKLYLENNYNDVQKYEEINERLSNLDKNIFPDDLFSVE